MTGQLPPYTTGRYNCMALKCFRKSFQTQLNKKNGGNKILF